MYFFPFRMISLQVWDNPHLEHPIIFTFVLKCLAVLQYMIRRDFILIYTLYGISECWRRQLFKSTAGGMAPMDRIADMFWKVFGHVDLTMSDMLTTLYLASVLQKIERKVIIRRNLRESRRGDLGLDTVTIGSGDKLGPARRGGDSCLESCSHSMRLMDASDDVSNVTIRCPQSFSTSRGSSPLRSWILLLFYNVLIELNYVFLGVGRHTWFRSVSSSVVQADALFAPSIPSVVLVDSIAVR